MAVTSRAGSTLNPDAPLFIPAAYQQVEDFSPEWWNLVQTSSWFRDYWLNERHENFVEDFDCIDDIFPDVHDLPDEIDEFSDLELQLEEAVLQGIDGDEDDRALQFEEQPQQQQQPAAKEFADCVKENDADALFRALNAKASKTPAPIFEPTKYAEKPPQIVSPKNSPRRIQQPR